jgi:glyoxylase-like metal-dependent hydrolase (beta-lactamase superfamily II)
MPDCRFEPVTARVDRFTPDERTDRPTLGAIRGTAGTLIVDGGASPAHLAAFAAELEAHGRPPAVAIALTHWHWDHSFGSSALDVPVIACAETAAGVAVQAGYAWDEASLRQRVAEGLELAFSLPHLLAEYTEAERTALRIVVPHVTFAEAHDVDLGDTVVALRKVGGDHAGDSVVIWEPEDRVLFTGDALYQCLWADEPYLTVAGVRALLDRLAAYAPAQVLEGHDQEILDAAAWAARLAELAHACDVAEGRAESGDEELVSFLRAARPG